ncbi:cutinase family protein [Mycolicibacterium confluentis]|nr:cutinase family protein [Mycolicibacterium confluentis]MCV7321867.1 cutinase family protein [Mycolicibacterium confluentis]ORV32122.1 cutinase [Mycolicibacterium confluentis]
MGLLLFPLSVTPTASADPCPDIGVAFARGTAEQPGPGAAGQRFIDSLRAQAFPRTVGMYGVNYPASANFAAGPAFTMNVVDGVRDEANHVRGVVSVCPQTQMVLGGYSQGAAVTALVTSGIVPAGVSPEALPPPLPPDVADNVVAVVLFGKPAGPALPKYGVPALDVGPVYAGRAQELCAPGDTVCSGGFGPGSGTAHVQYAVNGMADQAAAFAVSRLVALPAPV